MRCDGGMSRAMLWKPAALAASAVLLTLAAACGGGDGDAQVRGADGGGAGYAAITVGDETWELDGLLCWFHDGVDPDSSTLASVLIRDRRLTLGHEGRTFARTRTVILM
jgi:hypothetical protein